MEALEFSILDWIQLHVRCGALDVLMPAVSRICDHGEIWILLAAVLLAIPRCRRAGFALACGLVLDLIGCNFILKPLVGRARPFAVRSGVALLVAPPLDASFPSGHTAVSFAAAAALWSGGSRKMGLTAAVLACVIAFSRLYLYVHWPSDVLAGALVGGLLGRLGAALAAFLTGTRSHQRGEKTPGT